MQEAKCLLSYHVEDLLIFDEPFCYSQFFLAVVTGQFPLSIIEAMRSSFSSWLYFLVVFLNLIGRVINNVLVYGRLHATLFALKHFTISYAYNARCVRFADLIISNVLFFLNFCFVSFSLVFFCIGDFLWRRLIILHRRDYLHSPFWFVHCSVCFFQYQVFKVLQYFLSWVSLFEWQRKSVRLIKVFLIVHLVSVTSVSRLVLGFAASMLQDSECRRRIVLRAFTTFSA